MSTEPSPNREQLQAPHRAESRQENGGLRRLAWLPIPLMNLKVRGLVSLCIGSLAGLRWQTTSRWVARYGLAVGAVAAAFGFWLAATTWFGPGLPPFISFYPAVMAVALLAGLGPGLLTTALAAGVVSYWIMPPVARFAIDRPVDRLAVALFGGMGVLMSVFAELYRRNRDKAAAYDRETALRESQARLAAFAEATFEGIVESESGRIVDCNDPLARMLGYSVAELRGMEIANLIAPEDRDRVVEQVREGGVSGIEHDMLRKDGTRIIVEAHGRLVFPGSTRRHTAIRDITGRKRAEKLLQRYELLARHTRDVVLFLRSDNGRILEANAAAESAYGYTRRELLAMTISDLRAPGERASVAVQMAEADFCGILFETVHLRKDGRTFPVEVSSRGADIGSLRTVISVVRDITERKRAEESLRLSQQRFAAIHEHAPFAIALLKMPEGIITELNETWERMFGHSRDEAIGKTAVELGIAGDVDARARLHEEARRHGSVRDFELTYRTRSGECRLGSFNFERIEIDGQIYHLGTAIDITERKRTEEALHESEERYRLLFQSLQEGFYLAEAIFDEDGKCCDGLYLDVNPAFAQIMGRPRDQIIGKRVKELVPEIKPEWLEVFGKVTQTGEAISHQSYSDVFQRHFEALVFQPWSGRFGVLVTDISDRAR